MRHLLITASLAALLAVSTPAAADPRSEVTEAVARLGAAGSYVIHIDAPQSGAAGQIELHHVAPDRYRMIMPGGPTQTIIGSTVYMQMAGRTMRVPLPAGTLDKLQDQARIQETQDNARIESLGSDTVDGQRAQKYRIVHPDQPDAEVTMWVGSHGWPLQMQVDGTDGRSTMRYSRFNDPALVISAPD